MLPESMRFEESEELFMLYLSEMELRETRFAQPPEKEIEQRT